MVTLKQITVEVAYAKPQQQRILTLTIAEGSTIEQAIVASGILALFPEIDLTQQQVGIFSQLKKLTTAVKAGDRVEIYRPLVIDPKEARRQRGAKL